VGPEAYTGLGALFKKCKRYESEYLFRMKKETTTNYKFKTANKKFRKMTIFPLSATPL
jgi:hypothetical protein